MHIQTLKIQSRQLQEQQTFYEQILGLPIIEQTSQALIIQAGKTQLTLQATEQTQTYHFAFTISCNKFDQAKKWLQARGIVCLKDENGNDEFLSQSWNSRSLYFYDPNHNILEFIVHYDLHNETTGDFGPQDITHISEIGLVVDNVPDYVDQIAQTFDLKPYTSISETFAALGDINGLFIIVQRGRPWWPTTTDHAIKTYVDVLIDGNKQDIFQDPSQAPFVTIRQARENNTH